MRQVVIHLEDDVAHRLDILAAKDDQRIAQGIESLLTYLVHLWETKKDLPDESTI